MMMAPWSVSTPAKAVPLGSDGMTPDLVVVRRTGGGGGASVTWGTWAATAATRPKTSDVVYMVKFGVLYVEM